MHAAREVAIQTVTANGVSLIKPGSSETTLEQVKTNSKLTA